jgi:hypothetical protein
MEDLKNQFFLYTPPYEVDKTLVKITNMEPAGINLQRYYIAKGKTATKFEELAIPDPAFHNVDNWTRKHRLPPLEYCPMEWLQTEKAQLKSLLPEAVIPTKPLENPTPEKIWDIFLHCTNVKDNLNKIRPALHNLYKGYTLNQKQHATEFKRRLTRRSYETGADMRPTPSGVDINAIVSHSEAIALRSIAAMSRICIKFGESTGKNLMDYAQILNEWEEIIQNHIEKTTQFGNNWNTINEFFNIPSTITNPLPNTARKPWNKITPSDQAFFTNLVKSLQLC